SGDFDSWVFDYRPLTSRHNRRVNSRNQIKEDREHKPQQASSETINGETKIGTTKKGNTKQKGFRRPKKWVVSLYDFSLAVFPTFLVAHLKLSDEYHNPGTGSIQITWFIFMLGYLLFAGMIAFLSYRANCVFLPPGKNKYSVCKKTIVSLVFMIALYAMVPLLTKSFFEGDIVKESLTIIVFALINTYLSSILFRLPAEYRRLATPETKHATIEVKEYILMFCAVLFLVWFVWILLCFSPAT
ncbi:hypothetical protein ACTXIT_11220, partial [Corynebacterium casei]|uniref:hypothetical protein n=1 Tax=Corynebacterium casei TaxID=160386 RepID=UPI003FD101FA